MKRITMQDIADACGLSRNTVSKIFNNRGEVPDATRKLVLEKARQLGYYQFPAKEEPAATHGGTIAVLTQKKLLSVYCIIKIPKVADKNGESCISILEKIA